MTGTQAFPPLLSPEQAGSERVGTPSKSGSSLATTPRRRRSSGLGGEIRAGDTSAPALATLDVIPQSARAIKVCVFVLCFAFLWGGEDGDWDG